MERRAALFLDFDNVFSALMQRDVAAAAAFVRDPLRWTGWLERVGRSRAGRASGGSWCGAAT